MKKIISVTLCAIILLSVCACSGNVINTTDNLENINIGIIQSTKATRELEPYQKDKGCNIKGYYNPKEIDEAFRLNKIDCAVLDRNIAAAFVKDYSGYTVSGNSVGKGYLSFAALESNKVYQLMLNKAIDALTEDGTIEKIVNAYTKDRNHKYTPKKLDNSNGEFVIALDTALVPYCENDGLNLTGGPAIEILDAVCEYLGCSYTLLPTRTAQMTVTLLNETADFALGDITIMTTQLINIENLIETDPVISFDYVIVSKKQ